MEAVRICAGSAPKLMYAAITEPGIWRLTKVYVDTETHSFWLWCSFTVPYYFPSLIAWRWRWRHYNHLKYWELLAQWHSSSFNDIASHSKNLNPLQNYCENLKAQTNFLLHPSQNCLCFTGIYLSYYEKGNSEIHVADLNNVYIFCSAVICFCVVLLQQAFTLQM